ncbi:hypothetical protein MTO96_042121 [Rhipicephalus appendiculatus]
MVVEAPAGFTALLNIPERFELSPATVMTFSAPVRTFAPPAPDEKDGRPFSLSTVPGLARPGEGELVAPNARPTPPSPAERGCDVPDVLTLESIPLGRAETTDNPPEASVAPVIPLPDGVKALTVLVPTRLNPGADNDNNPVVPALPVPKLIMRDPADALGSICTVPNLTRASPFSAEKSGFVLVLPVPTPTAPGPNDANILLAFVLPTVRSPVKDVGTLPVVVPIAAIAEGDGRNPVLLASFLLILRAPRAISDRCAPGASKLTSAALTPAGPAPILPLTPEAARSVVVSALALSGVRGAEAGVITRLLLIVCILSAADSKELEARDVPGPVRLVPGVM